MFGDVWKKHHEIVMLMHVVMLENTGDTRNQSAATDGKYGKIEGQRRLVDKYSGAKASLAV